MAEIQTVYSENIALGYPGMVADGETSNRISRTNEDATPIPFGRPVFRGVGDHGCTATPAAGALLGIAIAHEGIALLPGGTADAFAQFQNVPIMTQGLIVVTASVAVNDGEAAHVTAAGAITNVSAGNTPLTGWVFDTSTTGAGLARLAKR